MRFRLNDETSLFFQKEMYQWMYTNNNPVHSEIISD